MKKQALLISVLSCVLTTSVWATESPTTAKASEELKTALKQHHDAMNKQDLKALLALYADSPNVALMGTGPGEFWKGKAAVEETYKHYFETFKPGSLSHECPEATGMEDGDNAWLMASCIMKDTDPSGQPREFGLNVSAVLKKEKSGWRFQALHFSNLVGEDAPPPEEDAAPVETPAPGSEPASKKAQ
ncbi:MAG: nuclear transport factor 2 family protein [Candidatus Competibacteraceae bacterium]